MSGSGPWPSRSVGRLLSLRREKEDLQTKRRVRKRPRFVEAIRDILELMTLYCVTVVVYFRENNG